MEKRARPLNGAERDFFRLVDRAAFSNPFGAEREDLDQRIAGDGESGGAAPRAIARVVEEVTRLERDGRADLRHHTAEDRVILANALLFETFHRFAGEFDRLIGNQIATGDRPCPVPFAGSLLAILGRRGFSPVEAGRTLGFFFQLRRAFYFIDRGLAGRCASMRELRRHLWNSVFTSDVRWYERYLWNRMEDFSTLLLGETGTGKGAAAAAIGRSGFIPFEEEKGRFAESFTRNFIPLNLSQFPETLIESELFGHRKGAFTGAVTDHQGLLARCPPHGTVFLDEIGDVSIPVQIKLLQVLQERTFSPVGSHETARFHGRVVAATNRPLPELREKGEFRDDFFYRLCSDVIVLPPLRQRLEEEPGELAELLVGLVQRTIGEPSPELAREILAILEEEPGRGYPWPGNVRELEQAVRRVLISRKYRGEGKTPDRRNKFWAGIEAGSLDAPALLAGYCALLYRRSGTYEQVARVTGLDRRTVKKYVLMSGSGGDEPGERQ